LKRYATRTTYKKKIARANACGVQTYQGQKVGRLESIFPGANFYASLGLVMTSDYHKQCVSSSYSIFITVNPCLADHHKNLKSRAEIRFFFLFPQNLSNTALLILFSCFGFRFTVPL
jgi:hypothetical protein